MAYRIQYGSGKIHSKKIHYTLLFPLFLVLISILLRFYIPQVDELTRELLFTDEAMEVFSGAFSEESSYMEAVSVFCSEVFID